MSDPPPKLLEAIGLVAVRWAGLETIIEISCAYLLKYQASQSAAHPTPTAFSQRVKFLRRSLGEPLFVHLRPEFYAALDETLALSRKRNDIMHGAFIKWHGETGGDQIIIRAASTGHIADANNLSVETLQNLALEMQSMFGKHFNLQDRLKALIRGFEGGADIGRRASFGGRQ
ncbi:hypothetical protein [Sphingopyxis sp. L1A2A]|uniref:hypothetical protein n=1 Tax=Sphingopyxis sp. L1A2A TaxID=2502247 RepID=UPI0010F68372|nr:hypothetical protein [Sphingopyxis sp. L1A2A]